MILDVFSLKGKVAIVTGCDTGLGQGIDQRLQAYHQIFSGNEQ